MGHYYAQLFDQAKPYLAVIMLQFALAGNSIISKFALNHGTSQHVLSVYRNAVAAIVVSPFAIFIDRKVRPKMTMSIFSKIVMLSLLEPVMDQNLYYTGMKYTTATFASAMCNILPALAFIMAWIFGLEKVNMRRLPSQAKVLGTMVAVGGAMLMTLMRGPILNLPWAEGPDRHDSVNAAINQVPLKGALMIIAGCICWSFFFILQAITLKSYPAALSLTALICFMGTLQGSLVALAIEWGNPGAWSLSFDYKLLSPVYSGVVSSGISYYIQGLIMKTRGPVFVTSFNPLSMVLVAITGSSFLSERLYLGRVIGAVVIVTGLYLVLWGKCKDRLSSNSACDKIAPSEKQNTMTNEKTDASIKEFVVVVTDDVRKGIKEDSV